MNSKPERTVYSGKYTPLSREELASQIASSMSAKRFKHVLGVEETAIQLADKYKVSTEAASIAALCHDYAKERSNQEMKELIIADEHLEENLLDYGSNIWHGPCAAEIVKKEFQLMDEDILNAIRYHTIGRSEMSLLEQVIYVADFIEPGRVFPGVEEARILASDNLQEAVTYETQHTLMHLIQTKKKIYPKAVATFNKWVANK